ncbi:MAG: AI-2E family transporter, partial [Firmicutes bacterium]|nr:AI-2E family transporter [Bacillota bacterium]
MRVGADSRVPVLGEASGPARGRRAGRLALLGGLTLAATALLVAAAPVLLPFGFALVLAYLLEPAVAALAGWGLPRGAAVSLVYVLAGAGLAAGLFYGLPVLSREGIRLLALVPRYLGEGEAWWDAALARVHQAPLPQGLHQALLHGVSELEGRIAASLGRLVWGAIGLLPGLASLVLAPVLAFFLLKDRDRIRERFWALVPAPWHAAVYKLLLDLDRALGGFVRGQLLVAAAVGLLALAWLWALGIPFAPLIAVLAAVTDIVPYLGP